MFNLSFKRALAATLALICLLSLASCGKNDPAGNGLADTDAILTLGGEAVGYDEYSYFFNNQKAYTDGGDETYWVGNDEGIAKLKEDTLYSLAQFQAIRMLAAENDVHVTAEQQANNDAAVESLISQYGEEEFTAMLAQDHLTLELYNDIMYTLTLDNNLYEALAANGTLAGDKEAVTAKILENYVRAMHILYADEATAQGILEQAKSCTDEEFYELAQAAEDPGMIGNTEGYVFTTGQMVEPFEKATYALEVGATSNLVASDFGYHIIRRLELTSEYVDEHYAELAASDLMNAYYTYVDDYAAQLIEGAQFSEAYDAFTVETSAK